MKGMDDFLRKLSEETDATGQEDVSKNLAKEDALRLIADFVKTVKTRFTKPADRLEILNAAEKTLRFYIDEIEGDQFSASLSVGSFSAPAPEPVPEGEPESDFDETGDEEEEY